MMLAQFWTSSAARLKRVSLSLYVKSQRTPWVPKGLENDTAFVGIGYGVKRNQKDHHVALGCSHIYNAYGQGLKYRLTKVGNCTFDKKNNLYLSYSEAYKFGNMIVELFYASSGKIPKRVVVHKRTHFKEDEINGIVDSLKKSGILQIELVEINYEADARFILQNLYQQQLSANFFPLHRGSCFLLDRTSALLWTHGVAPSVKAENRSYFLGGKSIPVPLKIIKHYGSSNIDTIATEILGLTKVNWNSFNMYAKLPATLQSSGEIARIAWLLNRFEGQSYDYRHFMQTHYIINLRYA
jgi:argonaute-like protein implicated in RNA metabolism and viral defense